MKNSKRFAQILTIFFGLPLVLVIIHFGLPLVLPFLVGLGAALVAEPLTRVFSKKLPRPLASGIAMAGIYALMCLGLYLLGRLALLELNRLTGQLPDLARQAQDLILRAERFLYRLAERAPQHLQQQMEEGLGELLNSGAELAKDAAAQVLGAVSRTILRLPDTLIFLVTALSSGFLISARLPRLKPWLEKVLPDRWRRVTGQMLSNMKRNVGLWLRAQCKLLGLTFCLLVVGFLVLRVKSPFVTSVLVTLVDALPVLGIGTVLLPWALVSLLQGQTALAIGMGSLYAVVTLVRSALEPRLVGRQLGLSPLLTLGGIYVGYRLWGILGMILAPVLLITLGELLAMTKGENNSGGGS